jgi:hypothetical protein
MNAIYPIALILLLTTAASKTIPTRQQRLHSIEPSSNNFEVCWKRAVLPIDDNALGLSVFDKSGFKTRGLMAKADYKESAIVLKIKPADCIYVGDVGDKTDCIAGLETLWSSLSGNSRLSLMLLKKWSELSQKGSTGNVFIDAYLVSLPVILLLSIFNI